MFIEKPASKMSIGHRSFVFGVGINDSDYITKPEINGKRTICPYYCVWGSLMRRCYYNYYKSKNPTYKDCTVCDEWIRFSNFKSWMVKQDWKGKELDKDILKQGNKVYSPEFCVFVTHDVNSLFLDCKKRRGNLPQGVSLKGNRYLASCRSNGKQRHIGLFDTSSEAFIAYKEFKYSVIAKVAEKQCEPLKSAMLKYKITELMELKAENALLNQKIIIQRVN